MNKLKKRYVHWKWQRRYMKAWWISCHKAYNSLTSEFNYSEDIDACDPQFYFQNELEGLKNYG